MHNELRGLLRTATGESQFVIAVNIDIRGFSSFFSDSSQAAAYLSSAYTEILDRYFPDVSFFKPTGDGLLLVRVVDRESLSSAVAEYVADAVSLEQNFAEVCAGDDLINFPTPERVGIGLARGTATRISGGTKVLDFSGYPLNLASRLMDLARPRGVVFDASFGPHLLQEETLAEFVTEAVYVKGLADLTPLTVYVTRDVAVPDANRRPFGAEAFSEPHQTQTFTQFKKKGETFLHVLQHEPSSRESVKLHLTFPAVDEAGHRIAGVVTTRSVSPRGFIERPEGFAAQFDYGALIRALEERNVKGPWAIKTQMTYSVPLGTVNALAPVDDVEPAASPDLGAQDAEARDDAG